MTDIIGTILERLAVLEGAVLGQKQGPSLDPRFERRISKREVAIREDRSTRQIERWVAEGSFPSPDEIVNGRWSWWLSTLQRHDRERAATARTPATPAPLSRKRKPKNQEDATA